MKKTSKSLAKKLAATFGAAVLASAMMVPAAFAEEFDGETIEKDWATSVHDKNHGAQNSANEVTSSRDTDTVTDKTAVYLKVKDDATRTISVTAPLAIYLAADYDSTTATDLDIELMTPDKDICYIQNFSKTVDLEVDSWAVASPYTVAEGQTPVVEGISKADYLTAKTNGETPASPVEGTRYIKQGDYYLTCLFDNTNFTPTTVITEKQSYDIAINSTENAQSEMSSTKATVMNKNATAAERASNTFLPMELDAHMYRPDGAANAFGQTDGAQLQNITWSFSKAE